MNVHLKALAETIKKLMSIEEENKSSLDKKLDLRSQDLARTIHPKSSPLRRRRLAALLIPFILIMLSGFLINKYFANRTFPDNLDSSDKSTAPLKKKNPPPVSIVGNIDICSVPAGAEVYIDDKKEGATPMKKVLAPGMYKVSIRRAPEFNEIMDVLKVVSGETVSRTYTLAFAAGHGVEIDSVPPGAEVFIGNKREGVTPLKKDLPPGIYKLDLKKNPEYQDVTASFLVEAGKPVSKTFILNPAYFLNIQASPTGADILIDGRRLGQTSVQTEFSKNTCRLRIENREDWSVIEETLTFKPGINRVDRALKRLRGNIEFKTEPAGARLILDEKAIGTSPLRIKLAVGEYKIRVEIEGYRTLDEKISVESDSEKNYTLSKLGSGKLIIKAQPYAEVSIEGKIIGEVPPVKILDVVEGKHSIVFVATKMNKKYDVVIDLKAGETYEIRMNMETGEQKIIKIANNSEKEQSIFTFSPSPKRNDLSKVMSES